jgi:hypothetical protein
MFCEHMTHSQELWSYVYLKFMLCYINLYEPDLHLHLQRQMLQYTASQDLNALWVAMWVAYPSYVTMCDPHM